MRRKEKRTTIHPKRYKLYIRFTALLLVFSLIFTSIPVGCFPASAESATEVTEPTGTEPDVMAEPFVIGEDFSRRGENEKHFLMSDGTRVAALYDTAVHYKDETGKYQEIDNSFDTNGDEYQTKKGKQKTKLAKKASAKKLVTVTREGHTISWGFDGAAKVKGEVLEDAEPTGEDDSAQFTAKNINGRMRYADAFPDVDLEYIVNPDGVKENVILKTAEAQTSFTLYYDIGKLTAQQTNPSTIALLDGDTHCFDLTAPVMVDADGNQSADLTLTLTEQKNGKLTVVLSADAAWLATAAYPVTVDPGFSTTLNSSVLECKYTYTSGSASAANAITNYTFVGFHETLGTTNSLYYFNTLPTLPDGSYLTNAKFGLSFGIPDDWTYDFQVKAYQCIEMWSYNTGSAINYVPAYRSVMDDYAYQVSGYSWNITNSVRTWYADSSQNQGIILVPEENILNYTAFYTSTYSNSDYRPVLILKYVNHSGVENYLSYTTADLGDGTAYVNNASGHLTAEIPVISTKGANMAAGLTLYYNGTVPSSHTKNKVGYGWRTNYDQRIDAITNTALKNAGYKYTYTDPDGTVIYILENEDTHKLEDSIGAGLTLTIGSSEWTLTDKDENLAVFDTTGKLIRQKNAASPSTITFSYDSAGRLIKITDGAGDTITLNRNSSGLLTGIVDSYNRTVTPTYSSNQLTKLTYFDGSKTTFSYAGNHMTSVVSSSDLKTEFTYSDSAPAGFEGRVYQIAAYSKPDGLGERIQGDHIWFLYTVDGVTQISDQNVNHSYLVFDKYGREIGSSSDVGASATDYTTNTGTNATYTNNKILATTSTPSPIDSKIYNGDFESSAGWMTYISSTGTASASNTTSTKRLGNQSLKLTAANGGSTTYFQRHTPTKSGYYTYSVYCKSSDLTAGYASAIVGMILHDGTKEFVFSTEKVKASTNGEWIRLSATAYIDITKVKTVSGLNGLFSAEGSVYFDCAQLEYAEVPSEYNMLQNGSFNFGTTGWYGYFNSGEGVRYISSLDLSSINQPTQFPYGLHMKSGAYEWDEVYQSITLNKPAKTLSLNYSAYAFALASKEDADSFFSLKLYFLFSDGTYEEVTRNFATGCNGWQYMTALMRPSNANKSKTVTDVWAYLSYCNQPNSVTFTGVQLTYDTTGTTYTYDSKGNPIKATDTQDNGVESSYDSKNRLTSKTMVDGAKFDYVYNSTVSDRLVTSATAPKNQKTDYTYNLHGQTTKTTTYNSTETDGDQITTETAYSANGKYLTGETDSLGTQTTYAYDTYDRTDKIYHDTDDQTDFTQYTYDVLDRTTAVSRKRNGNANSAVSVGYTYQNNLLTGISHNGFSYLFNYDLFGNTTKIMVGGRTLTNNTYAKSDYNNANSDNNDSLLLTRLDYGNGAYVEYDYDKDGQIVEKKYDGVAKYQYKYYPSGQIARLIDLERNQTYYYEYDQLERLNRIYRSDGYIINYQYDISNRLTQKSYTRSGVTRKTNFTYEAGGFLKTSQFENGSTRNYTYDSLARVGTMLTKTASNATTGWETEYSYYNPTEGQTTALVNNVNHKTLGLNLNYVYDKFGNIVAIKENNILKASYEYDNLHQLTRENNTYTGKTVVYDYDNGGNILSKTEYDYTTGSLEGLTGTVVQYTYGDSEWKDLLTAYNGQTITYDTIGNPLSYRDGMTFTWQKGRQMATANVNNTNISYQYNEGGIRTKKTVGSTNYYYYLDGTNIVLEKRGSTLYWYDYDASGERHSVTYNGATYYYYYNMQGDVIGLYDANLNSVVQYTYDSWGKVLSVTGSMADTLGQANPFRYRGYYYDSETGLYYLNSRYYDPITGRFINADGKISSGTDVLGANQYTYCGNNPVSRIDPSGEAWWHWAIGAAVVVACAALTVVTAGGAAAGMAAVAAVGSGMAAASTASTVAAGAFIGASIAYGTAVIAAASTSNSAKEFNDKGNWGTIASTALGAISGAAHAYSASNSGSTKSLSKSKFKSSSKLDKYVYKPQRIKNVAPAKIEKIAVGEKLTTGTLSKGSHAGQGFKVTWGGDRLLQYHPGGGHHGPNSYWKVSSGEFGTIHIFNDK